jgi:hypothetical protein
MEVISQYDICFSLSSGHDAERPIRCDRLRTLAPPVSFHIHDIEPKMCTFRWKTALGKQWKYVCGRPSFMIAYTHEDIGNRARQTTVLFNFTQVRFLVAAS